MTQIQPSEESQDEAESATKSTGSKPGNTLKNKITVIKEKAKNDIAELKNAQIPLKKDIRGKIYEINRRIKALNISIEQNLAQIEQLKNNPTDSIIPPKYAIKIKKIDNQNYSAVIKIYEDILLEHNEAIDNLDSLMDEKVALINLKADKQIDIERKNDSQRKQNQAAKAKAKAQAALKSKREARNKAKEEERESGLAVLRQHLPVGQNAPITEIAKLPKELSRLFEIMDHKFKIVNDEELVSKLVVAKKVNKYFSVIRQTMVDAISGSTPADLLLVSFEQVEDNLFDFVLYTFKNRRIERLATQYGFIKKDQSVNLTLPINLNHEHKDAVLQDLDMFFDDLSQKGFCTHIFDAQHNALFKSI